MKKAIINGDQFSTLLEFYDEIERSLTSGLDWKIGRNLNAFNDVLRGGFGFHEYEESIEIEWLNVEKNKSDLGYEETLIYLQNTLETCHSSNRELIESDIQELLSGKGETLFDIIIGIINADPPKIKTVGLDN